jgi:hypothetical protein
MRYYEHIATVERNGLTVILDKTWEDISPRDLFEEDDVAEIIRKIDLGIYDWFMLRTRVMFDGLEVASEYLGGCLYEDPREVMTDGLGEDQIHLALVNARTRLTELKAKLFDVETL